MATVTVVTIPSDKENKDVTYRMQKIVEDRNPHIAKRFGLEPQDVTLKLYFSTGALRFALDPNGETLGVFAGYVEGTNEILQAHPESVGPIFGDNLDKEMINYIDFSLTQMYFTKKYNPDGKVYNTYLRHLSKLIAELTANKFKPDIAKFEAKTFAPGKRMSKEHELYLAFYIMETHSGIDYVYSHLDKIVADLDIRKTIKDIYNKDFEDFVTQIQRKVLEEEKQLMLLRKRGRK